MVGADRYRRVRRQQKGVTVVDEPGPVVRELEPTDPLYRQICEAMEIMRATFAMNNISPDVAITAFCMLAAEIVIPTRVDGLAESMRRLIKKTQESLAEHAKEQREKMN
jgi:hypothetical protein